MKIDELNPDVKGPDAQYHEYLAKGEFMLQKSISTGKYTFYPRVSIPVSGETDLEWVPASGYGTIYAITVNRGREGSYNVAMIDLDEGPRILSRIEGVETAPIGSRVKASIAEGDDYPFIVFSLE